MHIINRLLLIPVLITGILLSVIDPVSAQDEKSGSILKLTVQPGEGYQEIHGFGASDAWSIQFVGKNWPLGKRNKIADLLFSSKLDEKGNPRGIGLSMWRFNIGAGSARQGEESGISDPWRRAESFLAADSTYDWTMQQGQQWFAKAAARRGVETFIGFVNSPPILLTKNGKAFGDGDGDANLAPERYEAFADYLGRIAQHFKKEGIPFDYLSPVNEPQWDWSQGNGQEGSPYQNGEIAGVVKQLDKKIREYNLETEIEIPETAQINFLYDGSLEGRSRQADHFFGPQSEIKQLPSLARKMAAHSYFTTWPVEQMIAQRKQLWQHLQQVDENLEYWMSEYCILANNDEVRGGGRDLGMNPALYVARLVHFDLTLANASSWQWWLAVSPYNFKDGLVYIEKNKTNGTFTDSKMLWALGNYSRFIRPGAVRVGLDRSDNTLHAEQAQGVMVSAYRNVDDDLVVVAVNYGSEDRKVQLQVEGSESSAFIPYITSSKRDLERQKAVKSGNIVMIPARSVVTLQSE